MTSGELRTAIETSLGSVPFVHPMSVAYCAAVRDDLRARLPVGAVLDVYWKTGKFIVEVCAAGKLEIVELDL